jgi:hypothetical protein
MGVGDGSIATNGNIIKDMGVGDGSEVSNGDNNKKTKRVASDRRRSAIYIGSSLSRHGDFGAPVK